MQDPAPLPARNLVLFVVLSAAVLIGWPLAENYFFPKPPPARVRNLLLDVMALQPAAPGAGVAGPAALAAVETALAVPPSALKPVPSPEAEPKKPEEVVKKDPPAKPPEVKPAPPAITLGGAHDDPADPFQLRVTFTPRGAAVEQVELTKFDHATVMGLPEKVEGKVRHLHLLNNPEPSMTKVVLSAPEPAFLVLHYDRPEHDSPRVSLARRDWEHEVLPAKDLGDGRKELGVRFTTTLADHGVKLTKTYTLRSGEYHVGLAVTLARLPDAKTGTPFRYQLVGASGLPVEGLWYTNVFRNALTGWSDPGGRFRRLMLDSGSIQYTNGGDPVTAPASPGLIRYAAVAVQYFASAIVVDDEQDDQRFLDRVRATAEAPSRESARPHLGDITVRAVTDAVPIAPGKEVTHKYLLYHGPVKVRLLRQLQDAKGALTIDPKLVDRYEYALHLNTMQDYPMQNVFGYVAGSILWSDLLIWTTNLMHGVLWWLHQLVPNYALCIILLTVLVRSALFPLTRKQIATSMKFQEQLKRLKPEFDKLAKKYGDDFQAMNQAKTRLMVEHGINPLAPLAGCLPLLIQMPIFMGLYYALQESIFFRLEPLWSGMSWIPNLAAPDMLFYWGQWIPLISNPESLGSPLYLGPYFNLLPVLAIALMFVQQMLMMPPPTNEQEEAQQATMKVMSVMFGIFFYKVPAGLCLYFIISSLWGLAERKLVPKVKLPDEPAAPKADAPAAAGTPAKVVPGKSERGKGGKLKSKAERQRAKEVAKAEAKAEEDTLMGKLRAAWQKVLDEAKKK